MRPGLVCLAEVCGRNSLPWSKRLDLDVYYVESWSLGLDFVITLRTIPVVVFRKGVYSPAKPPSPSQPPEVSETIKTDRK
jgi:lipopolysaccharide/colanic/teichoic acid biosynthesis glycosyltransferase